MTLRYDGMKRAEPTPREPVSEDSGQICLSRARTYPEHREMAHCTSRGTIVPECQLKVGTHPL